MKISRVSLAKLEKDRARRARSASWPDRAYFLFGYCSGLCALGLIGFSIYVDLKPEIHAREHHGWDLSGPREVDHRTIGQ